MNEKHCKDVVETLFEKKDRHHRHKDETEPLPELEPLDYQQGMEQQRLHKTHKSLESEH